MRSGADVVVIGAGIVGSSIAFQLATHGAGSVVALDKGLGPAEGSTGASSSICRCRYTYPEVVRLAFHGQKAFGNWSDFLGMADPISGLHRVGVLWLLGESTKKVNADADKLQSQGVAATALTVEDMEERFPQFSTCAQPLDFDSDTDHECEPGEAFLLEEEGGYADPVGANQDLLNAAQRKGVDLRFGSEVVDLIGDDGGVRGVRLADGTNIEADLVINAAGPWCNRINRMADLDLRWTLSPTRIQTVYRSIPEGYGPLPVSADSSAGIYFRPQGTSQMLVGSVLAEDEEEEVEDPDHFKTSPDAEFKEVKLAALSHRLPDLDPRATVSGIAGLYTVNREDVHPIVGPTGRDGFWVANGFSGHGFKLAPAIGSMMAQAVTGSTVDFDTDVPMSFFAVDRDPIELSVKHVLA